MHRQQRFKKKEEGAAESSYSFSSTPVSMGTRTALCGLNKSPSPPPNVLGPLPWDCICVANASASLTLPAPIGPQQQHPAPQKQKEKNSLHPSWIKSWSTKVSRRLGARIQPRGPRPSCGFWPHFSSLLQAGYDYYFSTLFMHNTHTLRIHLNCVPCITCCGHIRYYRKVIIAIS